MRLYAEQLRKQFEGAGELEHAERQLRVIQARLSDNLESLPKGDDPKMDVEADYVASADTTLREAPDADAIDLGEAVEAVRSPEEADTPKEVSDALQDELESPDNTSVLPDSMDTKVDKITSEQIERIEMLAEIAPGRLADRMMRVARMMDREEAQEAIEDLEDIIQSTDNPQKLAALKAPG